MDKDKAITWGVCWYPGIKCVYSKVIITSWDALKKAIHAECRVDVTHDEFAEMKHDKDATVQDHYKKIKGKNGVLVGGISPMLDGQYTCKTGSVIKEFCVLALDFDDGLPSDFQQRFERELADYTYCAYTTVSSTDALKRWRIIIPLAHSVNAEVRNALMRTVTDKIGWAGFDIKGLLPTQRMALPVTLAGETTTIVDHDGKMMDESYLPADWTPATLPKTPKEREEHHQIHKVQKRALTPMKYQKKDRPSGVIGAFLRAYNCQTILERSGLYHKQSETEKEIRFSRQGDSMGGIVVYPEDIAVCYYASDKLSTLPPQNSFGLYANLMCDGDYEKAYASAKVDAEVRDKLAEEVAGRRPATAGNWGDADAYSPGWRGLLERLAEYKQVRYVITGKRGQGYWLCYDGKRYGAYTDKQLSRDIADVAQISIAMNPDLADAFSTYINDNGQCLKLVKSLAGLENIAHDINEWDADTNLLCCADGVLDIKRYIELATGGGDVSEAVLPHSPEYLITKLSPPLLREAMNPDPEAESFVTDYMNEVMPKKELQDYMFKAIGSSLTDVSMDNKIIVLQGRVGRNSKSTFVDGLSNCLGEYFMVGDADDFAMGKSKSGQAKPTLDALRNARLVTFSETNEHLALDVSMMKRFWGSKIVTRGLFQDPSAWTPKFRGVYDLNTLPRLSNAADEAFKKRFRIIPWEQSFYGRERPEIQLRMRTDPHVWAALMNRLLVGLVEWAKSGYMLDRGDDIPAAVQTELQDYFNEVDDISNFIESYLEITNDQQDFIPLDRIVAEYENSGGAEIRKNSFSKQFKSHMMELAKTNVNVKEGRAYMKDRTRPRGWFGIQFRRLSDAELVEMANAESTGRHWSSYEVGELREMVDKSALRSIQVVQEKREEQPLVKQQAIKPQTTVKPPTTASPPALKSIEQQRAEWGYTAEEIPF